ncbi:unnamed protein product [Arabis nemorensis]|uniref:Uncharacterized protein n=1 Tax=Arabis nemorensis TaxID=586526 RepID=A0A565C1K7_9BRAS|nr:unnamed protein product [Arabis nemorensis]
MEINRVVPSSSGSLIGSFNNLFQSIWEILYSQSKSATANDASKSRGGVYDNCTKYIQLNCGLGADSEEFSKVANYMENTHAKTIHKLRLLNYLDLRELLKLLRDVIVFSSLKNMMLLGHGVAFLLLPLRDFQLHSEAKYKETPNRSSDSSS